jgi:glycine/D-amino acid oxidase-like deaminating enzyme/nitrite reductase/ring-hydroxylating ferredoxin subunit
MADDLQGVKKSYWLDSTALTNYPTLNEDIKIEVAIIGGGITGITAAELLKKQGVKVAIIEANRIIQGTTGHTTAKITTQHHLIYHKLINAFGLEKAKQYADANEFALEFIDKNIRQNNIHCDFRRLSAYMYTNDDAFIEKIQNETDAALKLGLKAKYLQATPLPFSTKAALSFENQAEFHPRKYLLPIAEKIPGDGSYIFENTIVVAVEEGNPCVLLTDKGNKITCGVLIIASHFPCYDGLGLYFTKLRPDRSYVIGATIKEKFPDGIFINAEEPGRSLRSQNYKDGQLVLVGGEGHKTAHGENTINHYKNLIDFAESTFNVQNILYRWSTQDYITLDSVPYVGLLNSRTENIYVATGYGKWGMTNGIAAAVILKDLIMNIDNPWKDVYNPSRSASTTGAKNFIIENFDVAKELIIGKIKSVGKNLTINEGEGKIVELEGAKYGAYKDHQGITHIVDITCTHLGCELKWNIAEKSWDCPCHGSRFSYEGDIIEGPAVHRLNHFKEEPNKIHPNLK